MENVVLVNEADEQTGIMEKLEAHEKALLHRAVSVFLFNAQGDMLLQQRADAKYHSGGLWTNTCCSHPRPGEEPLHAAQRRLREEMGIVAPLQKAFTFTYKAAFGNGLTEYEFDHVFTGSYEGAIIPDPAEVQDFCYRSLPEIEADLVNNPDRYTVWFAIAFPLLRNHLLQQVV